MTPEQRKHFEFVRDEMHGEPKQEQGEPVYGIRGGLAHDAGSGSYVSWDNTKCNPIASPREQAKKAWEDGYASAKRTWVGLTIEEVNTLWDEWKDAVCLDHKTWAQAIRAKLKEKNYDAR